MSDEEQNKKAAFVGVSFFLFLFLLVR